VKELPMRLADIITRPAELKPWSGINKIPWHEPEFSRRMLREHLSQEHDLASRRLAIIDEHVQWIHEQLLEATPSRILDLGCGPGFYTSRLAEKGHTCTGIDFSPASIEYATGQAAEKGLRCRYRCEDICATDYGTGFDLVMMVFGEINVFPPAEARKILEKARAALAAGGALLLEPHRAGAVEKIGEQGPAWHAAESGFFSDAPHLWLEESSWDPKTSTAAQRFFVIDAATGEVTQHGQTIQAYSNEEYQRLLAACGFPTTRLYATLGNTDGAFHESLMAIVAR
jgi:SAM-dependent methyltransferase